MTKQLTPLRQKDIATGRKLEREAIIKYLEETADILGLNLEEAGNNQQRAEAYYHCRSCMLAAKAIADGEHLTPLEKTNSG